MAFWDVATCFGGSTFWWKSFSGGGDVVWLRYSFHHRDTKWSMQGGWPSFLKLLELQGLTAPVKWKIFALWPNLQLEKQQKPFCALQNSLSAHYKWVHFTFLAFIFLQFKCCLFGKQMLRSLQIEEQKKKIYRTSFISTKTFKMLSSHRRLWVHAEK